MLTKKLRLVFPSWLFAIDEGSATERKSALLAATRSSDRQARFPDDPVVL